MNQFSLAKLDTPEILNVLFHPRREKPPTQSDTIIEQDIPVDDGVTIGCRFHLAASDAPNILFFHGNGEIASDYDEIGPLYNTFGYSFLVADYRGYGTSSGTPTAGDLLNDSHTIFNAVKEWLATEGRTGPLFVMGRSLGSACAIELGSSLPDDVTGIIIESGFSHSIPLLLTMGVDIRKHDIAETDCFCNVQKITNCSKPTLIIHASRDQIIPVTSAEILQANSAAKHKVFQVVPGADHNTLFEVAGMAYFELIQQFINKVMGVRPKRKRYKPRR
ncbi:MAG: alpha/beta fold hydrolase [Desulfobulbaceae bacterium]|nr:alpha/beta fold hydrolase [Desulfobulbaceae bacterium]